MCSYSSTIFLFSSDSQILESPVTEREFLEQLHELNHKINFVKEQSFKEAKSCQDVKDVVEKLKFKVTQLKFGVNDADLYSNHS